MGFGLLFIGMLVFYNPLYTVYSFPISAVFMLAGLWKLGVYNKGFKLSRNILLIWLVPSITALVFELIPENSVSSLMSSPLKIASYGCEMLFMLFLLTGIEMIAKETSLPKLISKARFRRSLAIAYYALVFLAVSAFGSSEAGKLLGLFLLLFGLIFKLLVLFLVWSCYMYICLEGDEDMPERPLRFGWMNSIRNFYNKVMFPDKPKEPHGKQKGGKKNGKK